MVWTALCRSVRSTAENAQGVDQGFKCCGTSSGERQVTDICCDIVSKPDQCVKIVIWSWKPEMMRQR